MKSTLILAALLTGFAANAKIDVTAGTTTGSAIGPEATHMMQVLEKMGAKGYASFSGVSEITIKGKLEVENGATCDNGHQVFEFELTEVDSKGNPMNTQLKLDNTDACTKKTEASNFNDLLQQWGGNILAGNCGLGHCWMTITSIDCQHFPADGKQKAFDSCDVNLDSGNGN